MKIDEGWEDNQCHEWVGLLGDPTGKVVLAFYNTPAKGSKGTGVELVPLSTHQIRWLFELMKGFVE